MGSARRQLLEFTCEILNGKICLCVGWYASSLAFSSRLDFGKYAHLHLHSFVYWPNAHFCLNQQTRLLHLLWSIHHIYLYVHHINETTKCLSYSQCVRASVAMATLKQKLASHFVSHAASRIIKMTRSKCSHVL